MNKSTIEKLLESKQASSQSTFNKSIARSLDTTTKSNASMFVSMKKSFTSMQDSLKSIVKTQNNIISTQKSSLEAQKKEDKREKSDKQRDDARLKSDKQKSKLDTVNKSFIEKLQSKTEGLTKTVGNIKQVFDKGLGGFVKTLLKAAGLFALLTNPEAVANAIKTVSDGFVTLADTLKDPDFQKGIGILGDFMAKLVKFGIVRLTQGLEGISKIANAFDELQESFSNFKNFQSWDDFKEKLRAITDDLGLFATGVADVGIGFGTLAAMLAPGAALMLGLKAFASYLNLFKPPAVTPPTPPSTPAPSSPAITPPRTIASPSGLVDSAGRPLQVPNTDATAPKPARSGVRGTLRGLVSPRNIALALIGIFQEPLSDMVQDLYGRFGVGVQSMSDADLRRLRTEIIEQQAGSSIPPSPIDANRLRLIEREATRRGLEFQAGAHISGNGNGDHVPAMLERGEYVLNKKAVSSIGVDNLNKINFSSLPRFQQGGVIEYITGDRSSSNYRADHGADNYHEHFGFESKAVRDAAITHLQRSGFVMGSIDRPGDPGYHGSQQGLDVPLGPHLTRYSNDQAGEEEFSADVRAALVAGGFTGSGVGAGDAGPVTNPYVSLDPQSTAALTTPATSGLQSLLSGLSGFTSPLAKMFDVLKPIASFIGSSIMGGVPAMASERAASQATGDTPPSSMTPGQTQTKAQLKDYLKQAGFDPSVINQMAAIGMAESSGDPKAYNGRGSDHSYGLWQLNMKGAMGPERRSLFGISRNEDLFDPLTNARAAKAIYDQQGITAWGAYTNGSYAQYLKRGGSVTRNPNAHGGSNMKTQPLQSSQGFQQVTQQMIQSGGHNPQPIIVPIPMPQAPASSGGSHGTSTVPTLSSAPMSAVASDYIFRFGLSSKLN